MKKRGSVIVEISVWSKFLENFLTVFRKSLCKLPNEFTPILPFVFIHFPLAVNSNAVRFIFAGRC